MLQFYNDVVIPDVTLLLYGCDPWPEYSPYECSPVHRPSEPQQSNPDSQLAATRSRCQYPLMDHRQYPAATKLESRVFIIPLSSYNKQSYPLPLRKCTQFQCGENVDYLSSPYPETAAWSHDPWGSPDERPWTLLALQLPDHLEHRLRSESLVNQVAVVVASWNTETDWMTRPNHSIFSASAQCCARSVIPEIMPKVLVFVEMLWMNSPWHCPLMCMHNTNES